MKYPFEPNPPYVPKDSNPIGLYRRNFVVPTDWKDEEIFLHFAGVQSAMYVWLNGEKVGYHEDGMLPAEFNISKYLQKGENQLTVQVLNWSVVYTVMSFYLHFLKSISEISPFSLTWIRSIRMQN